MQGKISGPKMPPTYHVLARKFEYGVDYGNYMHEVAADIGAAPDILTKEMLTNPITGFVSVVFVDPGPYTGPPVAPHAILRDASIRFTYPQG